MTSAVLHNLAFVFPDDLPIVRQHPRVQYLFYLPSLGLWGGDRLTDVWFNAHYHHYEIGALVTNMAASSSPVAREPNENRGRYGMRWILEG